jgi:hypothetical protein
MNIFCNINWNESSIQKRITADYIPADLRHIKGDLTIVIGNESIKQRSTTIIVDLIGIINTIYICSKNFGSIYDIHVNQFAECSVKCGIVKNVNVALFISKIDSSLIHSQPIEEVLYLCDAIEQWIFESILENKPELTTVMRDCIIMK